MRHLYRCPIRWADLDMLGHVNNVIYVDYLQEARIDMLRTHAPEIRATDVGEGLVVVRHEVQFVAPLMFRAEPVSIECWVTEIRAGSFTMAYEVFDETATGRRVYLRATTVLAPFVFAEERPRRLRPDEKDVLRGFVEPSPLPPSVRMGEPKLLEAGHYPLHVRFSDVDAYGHVNNVKYFEYFQEARIAYITHVAHDGSDIGVQFVVAQCDVDYKTPILFRGEPYRVQSWVSHVGRSSFGMESIILDGDTVLSRARVVMVTFDRATQRSVPAPERVRALFQEQFEAAARA
ncbi:thioesterase family protein [Nocardioides dubius]|uniref:Acyl-CoA thioesterase n=1 Tax=Nocardioides dubius TaxID=317019 RepID=A0ABN1U098_9ACTN